MSLKFHLTIERRTKKKLNDDALREQLQFIGDAVKRNASNNFDYRIPGRLRREIERGVGDNRELHYTAVIEVTKDRYNDEDSVRRRFEATKSVVAKAANRKGWTLIGTEALIPGDAPNEYVVVNGAGEPTGDPAPAIIVPETKIALPSPYLLGEELPPLTDEVLATYFHRIYDREAHIRIIYDNLKVAVKTKFKVRHHILLKGKPACAKTELFLAFIDWLGDDLIESIDASTMTKAGLERMLLEKSEDGTLKPILVMEEIEKCADENVACLIQVMDARGRIQRVNANTVRDGNGVGDCKIVVWGTCNDSDGLKKFHDGAIWSRFGNKLDCLRPDRALMEKILHREITEIEGKDEWVDVVLNFCYDELGKNPRFKDEFDDPRFARALLVGGDRLLDDSPSGFLADFRKVCDVKR